MHYYFQAISIFTLQFLKHYPLGVNSNIHTEGGGDN